MLALIALLIGLALDQAFVQATVESLGRMIGAEYFDPAVGREGEGAGVTPDVKTSAAEALKAAHARALRALIALERPGSWRDGLEHALKTVEAR